MNAPCIRPDTLNCSVRNLPKRDELLFHTVLAQPKFSMIGFVCSTRSCRSDPARHLGEVLEQNLGRLRLPRARLARDDHLWLFEFCIIPRCALEATAYTCGGSSTCGCSDDLYWLRIESV